MIPSSAPAGERRRQADRRLGVHLLVSAVGAAGSALAFGLLLVLVEDRWTPLRRLDTGAADGLHRVALRHHGWTRTLEFLSAWVWSPAVLRTAVALLVGWLLHRRAWRLAVWAAVTAVASGLVGLLVKTVVARARPSLADPVAHAPGYSFPSGHAMTATTSFAIFLLALLPLVPRRRRWVCWTVAGVSVVGVGFTRIALGVHWCSDVIGGWLLGLAVVAATAWAFQVWRTDAGRRRTQLAEGLEPELERPEPERAAGQPDMR